MTMCSQSAQVLTVPQLPSYAVPTPPDVPTFAQATMVTITLTVSTTVAVVVEAATPNFHPCSFLRFSRFDRAVAVLAVVLSGMPSPLGEPGLDPIVSWVISVSLSSCKRDRLVLFEM